MTQVFQLSVNYEMKQMINVRRVDDIFEMQVNMDSTINENNAVIYIYKYHLYFSSNMCT